MKIADLYQHVTNSIISDLEKGVASWVKPWKIGNGGGVMPMNAVTKRAYSASTSRSFGTLLLRGVIRPNSG